MISPDFCRILNLSFWFLRIFGFADYKGQSGEVIFEITKEDMPKMKDARHIDLNLHLTGRDQGEALKKGQKTTFNLKLKKEGGISI